MMRILSSVERTVISAMNVENMLAKNGGVLYPLGLGILRSV